MMMMMKRRSNMDLPQLLAELRAGPLILVSESEIWPAPGPDIEQALRKHRRALRELIAQADIATCPSPTWHRKYWRYEREHARFVCEVCERIHVS